MENIIHIKTAQNSHKVTFGALDSIDYNLEYEKILIISNPKVCALHIQRLLDFIKKQNKNAKIFIHTMKDGEQYKNLNSVDEILKNAFIHKLDRKSLMIAFGGGVVSDIVGFAAGIYQRGIDFINIPTTLLAQVDASVGGKTGINCEFGKNLIGLFNQPKAVFIDTIFLNTLARREFNAGISEIIKMAVCFDESFFNWLLDADLSDSSALKNAIFKSVEIKAGVVNLDEKEGSIRAGLNYGHTFGHVIELLGDYKVFLHGEAVGLGMLFANNLALKLNKINAQECAKIKDLIARFNLPTSYKISNALEFYEKFYLDKKSQNDKLNFIIPNHIGKFEFAKNPPKELLMQVLEQNL